MTTVVFVPGLQGHDALKYGLSSKVGPNEAAVQQSAKNSNAAFAKLNYQSNDDQNPLLSKMQAKVAAQLDKIVTQSKGEPIIIVASSLGFGVSIGALSFLKNSTSPIGLIGFKPIPDPLMAIELQINHPPTIARIKNAETDFEMPVQSTDGKHDVFNLAAKHLNDKRAVRVLAHSAHMNQFNYAVASTLAASVLVYGQKDHLTPASHMKHFADSVCGIEPVELVALQGNHSSDFTDNLYDQITQMTIKLG